MSITISDYPNVTERAAALGLTRPTGIAILPVNFDSAKGQEELLQRSEAATVKSLLRQSNLQPDNLLPRPNAIGHIQNNGFEWVGPTIFVSASLFSSNPSIVAISINVLSNYLTDFFKGISGTKRVKLEIVMETTANCAYKKLSR